MIQKYKAITEKVVDMDEVEMVDNKEDAATALEQITPAKKTASSTAVTPVSSTPVVRQRLDHRQLLIRVITV
eukprot:3838335-Ditylum_brightwellii.AAC.1